MPLAAVPSRYVRVDAARARFGDRVDRLAPFLLAGDPAADAAVAAIEEAVGADRAAAAALIDRALRTVAGDSHVSAATGAAAGSSDNGHRDGDSDRDSHDTRANGGHHDDRHRLGAVPRRRGSDATVSTRDDHDRRSADSSGSARDDDSDRSSGRTGIDRDDTTDPHAPAIPDALSALVTAAATAPTWVDWDVVDRGGRLLLRAGALGGIVLGAKSLVFGYCAPAGNKPLVLSGRLTEQAARRLNETARFVQAVVRAGGMRPGGDGFNATVKVRLMHAQVRRYILRSNAWRADEWGLPINQHDMVATTMLFSLVVIEGLRQFGLHVSRDESDDYMHLWRWVAHVIGVAPELTPTTEREAQSLADLIAATQAPPDDDSRQLVEALMHSGEQAPDPVERRRSRRARPLAYGLCRALIGDALADDLGLPRSPWTHALAAIRAASTALEAARRRSSWLEDALVEAGSRYWDTVVRRGFNGATHEFALPVRLDGLRAPPAATSAPSASADAASPPSRAPSPASRPAPSSSPTESSSLSAALASSPSRKDAN